MLGLQDSQCGITSQDDVYQNNIVLNKDCEAFILTIFYRSWLVNT